MPTTVLKYEYIQVDKKERMAWITLTRERYLNAFDSAAVIQLRRVALAIQEDPQIRVVVIRGQGRAFSTGIDLKELSANGTEMAYFSNWECALRIFETMSKIVIVGLQGYCLGGGLQLALASDIRVGTPDCQIGLPAIKEALIPGLGPWRLPRYIGLGRAKKLVLGGENICGQEAFRIGLLDHLIAEDESFYKNLDEIAYQYLQTCSVATRKSKQLLNRAFDREYDQIYQEYMHYQESVHYSLDSKEAKSAYQENRIPSWQ